MEIGKWWPRKPHASLNHKQPAGNHFSDWRLSSMWIIPSAPTPGSHGLPDLSVAKYQRVVVCHAFFVRPVPVIGFPVTGYSFLSQVSRRINVKFFSVSTDRRSDHLDGLSVGFVRA